MALVPRKREILNRKHQHQYCTLLLTHLGVAGIIQHSLFAVILPSTFTSPSQKPSRKLLSFNFAMGQREVNCMIFSPQLILAHENKTCTSRNISCYAWREICQSLCLPSFGGTFQSSFKERQAKKVIWRSLNRRRLHEQNAQCSKRRKKRFVCKYESK